MIEYVPYSGEPQAMNCPAFVCDTCRKQVVGDGNVIWCVKVIEKDGQRQQSPLFVSHKGRCDQALDKWLGSQYPLDEDWINLWEEISVFRSQLGNNADRSFADDPNGDYHELILRMPPDPHSEQPKI